MLIRGGKNVENLLYPQQMEFFFLKTLQK
ncbi:hypothetical protein B14911_04774 [Bacillus sp. NRRL B-14911]|nr:hypothetical protein B14911_04774 [Bacillus sp. NRRL B-14911]